MPARSLRPGAPIAGAVVAVSLVGFVPAGSDNSRTADCTSNRTVLVAISIRAAAVDCSYPTANGTVDSIVADGRGGWFVGGQFTSIGGVRARALVRLTPNGEVDRSWKVALPASTDDIPQLALVGRTLYAATPHAIVALDRRTGTTRWRTHANGYVNTLAANATRVFVAGNFTRIGGRQRRTIAALDSHTGRALRWRPSSVSPSDGVAALALAGRWLYVGGTYTSIGRERRSSSLARLDAATGKVSSWSARGANIVETLAVGAGQVFTAGHDSFAVNDERTGLIRPWMKHVAGLPNAFAVVGRTLFMTGDCRVGFTAVGGKPRHNLAAVTLPSGRVLPWAPKTGVPCFSAIGASANAVLVAG